MTVIAILNDDFEILFSDEKDAGNTTGPGMRTVRRASGATSTVYTTNQLYSAVADASDDFIAMGFTNPMLPVTPNAYTMENQYFIPRSSTQYLKEGAITADWAFTVSPDAVGNGVVKVAYSGGTNFVDADISKLVTQTGTGHTGTLLDFDRDQDGTTIAWIRPTSSSTDTFSGTGALTSAGTGATTASVAGVNGESVFSAIQAIGSVPTATEVYIYQDRNKLQGWGQADTFQWWVTDADLSLGIISILAQVKDSGTLVADGDVEVFARRYSALYDNFRLNVATGGFSALPLASAPDINNTTGYSNSGTLASVTGTPTVGNGVYVGGTFATADAKGVVTAGDATNFDYYLIGDLTDLGSTTAVTGYDFATSADDGFSATTGTKGDASGGPTDATATNGGTVTITLGHVDVDHTGAGGTEPYSMQIDCQGDVPIASVYERIKYVTRRGGDAADLFGAGTNVPGESYRGLDAIFEWDATGGAGLNADGDDIDTITGGSTWTARLMANSTGTTPTYFTATDQQTSIDAIVDNDIVRDETVTDTQTVHAGGTVGIQTFTSPKSSPFGTFTGSQIFGARGVNYINFASADAQAYILTDDLGTLNNPPNTVSFTVTNTAALDRILVARDTGVSAIIDKDQFGGIDTPAGSYNSESDQEIRAAGTVDVEVAQAGYVRVVETTLQQEHHYVYSSRTSGANGVFTLKTAASFSGTAGVGTSDTVLEDAGQAFVTDGVEVGMLIQVLTGGGAGNFYEVTAVTDADTLAIVQIFGTGGGFVSGDTYEINRLIQTYATADDIYDLILDLEATGASVVNSFTKTLAANFGVVVNVRQGKTILPFTLNQTQGDGSTTVTVVRQPDNIAT